MPNPVTVKIAGLDQIQHVLEVIPRRDAAKALRSALKAGADPIKQAMVREAPKDSGFLSSHFNVKVRVRGANIAGFANIGPEGKVDYPFGAAHKGARLMSGSTGRVSVLAVARWLEFGTRKMAANPFLSRAFQGARAEALSRITESLKAYVLGRA